MIKVCRLLHSNSTTGWPASKSVNQGVSESRNWKYLVSTTAMDRSEPGKSERRIRGNVQYGITRINFSLYWITLDENDRKQLHLSYARRGETSRDLMCSLKACHANCMHRWKCVVFKCVVAWKTVPFHDRKLLKNTLQISRNYFIPHRNEEKMNYAIMIFLVSILKIGVITSSRTLWSSFTLLLFYLHCFNDVVAAARSSDAKCSVAFPKNKQRRISYEDNLFKRPLNGECLLRRANSRINVRRINAAILHWKWRLHRTNNKIFHYWSSHRGDYPQQAVDHCVKIHET